MTQEELKHSAIYQSLKKDKKAQQAFVRLGKNEDWSVLKRFVAELKQTLLEASLDVDSIEEMKRYKHLIRGFESIALLPRLVESVKKLEKDDAQSKAEKEEDAKRRKFNPGGYIKRAFRKGGD
jgi:hypothetical protein